MTTQEPPTASELYTWRKGGRILLKALILFLALNVAFAVLTPLPLLGRLSWYNILVPGRERLPYGENLSRAYNLSLNSLEAMFASHEISQPKAPDEFRVLLVGDSATWGMLLPPADTLAAALNAAGYTTADGRRARFYNLGYPIMSLTKDLLLLDYALQYQPDLIVWLVTLESFPRDKQLFPPLVQRNPDRVRALIADYALDLDPGDPQLFTPDFWGQTIVGRRRDLADWLRLQMAGLLWGATGIDQDYPEAYTPRQEDFEEDRSFHQFAEPQPLTERELAFDVLRAGVARAGNVPVLLVNEPMFVSAGQNSDLRYNFFYPRWAYDAYRDLLRQRADAEGWLFLDLWGAIDMDQFTDSAVHYTPEGARQLAEALGPAIVNLMSQGGQP